ncbi:MAG: malto-oligosyltrehalose trehalohydrolase [Sumerlaeia bacterium]
MLSADPSEIGAVRLADGSWQFRLWAPAAQRAALHFPASGQHLEMQPADFGYLTKRVADPPADGLYFFRLDGGEDLPDPASRSQPHGVHGPSRLASEEYDWRSEKWPGVARSELVIYEMHVGAFTREGTFAAAIAHLEELKSLGVTAIEIMPAAQFPGGRNWGYDGVFPFAVQDSYGGPLGLKQFVDACHLRGMAVILDVVYNHLGPEGNVLHRFGPYFTDRYRTPWGSALNFDGKSSDPVRAYFLANATYWLREFRVDGLRVDAVHAIYDNTAQHFLQDLAEAIHEEGQCANRQTHIIAESKVNSPRHTQSLQSGGFGMDMQWNDDFQHALHALITGERNRHYADHGELAHMEKAYSQGFVLTGQYSHYRQRRHGVSSRGMEADRFVVFAQSHDDIGNRADSQRLAQLAGLEFAKLAAAATLLSPYIPMLFMGEEYAEPAPFHYFTSHSGPGLIEAVRRGRRQEFGHQSESPDPQAEETFTNSKLNHALKSQSPHREMRSYYKELLHLRRALPPLRTLSKENMLVLSDASRQLLSVRRWADDQQTVLLLNFSNKTQVAPSDPALRVILDSADSQWAGPGPAPAGNIGPASCQLLST